MDVETTVAGEMMGRAELGGALGGDSGGHTGFCTLQCHATPQFYQSSSRQVALDLHMDDIHGAAFPSGPTQFAKCLSPQLELKGGDGCEW